MAEISNMAYMDHWVQGGDWADGADRADWTGG